MKSGIWHLAGVSLLCLSISAQALAEDQQRDQLRGSSNNNGGWQGRDQQNDAQQQQYQQQRQQQQQFQQQQNQQREVERQQQRQIQEQQNQQRNVERQQQQQIQQQQNQQRQQEQQNQRELNQQQQNQQRQIQEQQNQQRQIQRQQLQQQQNNLPIQSGPREAWQTQPPRQGYYQDNPRGNQNNYRPNDRWTGRPDGHGNGWGPGPQYRPGHVIDRVPDGYSRVPYRGQDYFYSSGYWYRPQGPRYVVVTPPYGVRVQRLPEYSQEVWIGSSLFFLAAGTYYAYQQDTQDYVVANPPQTVQPAYAAQPQQGNGYDPVAYPTNGQSPEQVQEDHYQCYRWSVEQSSFDPANITSQPAPAMVEVYRRSMRACLMGIGYSVN